MAVEVEVAVEVVRQSLVFGVVVAAAVAMVLGVVELATPTEQRKQQLLK